MKNKFLILEAVYFYYNYPTEIEQTKNIEEFIVSEQPYANFSKVKRNEKKTLKMNFGIVDKKSLDERLNYYLDKEYFSLILSILIDLYIEKPDEFSDLEEAFLTDFLSDEYLVKKMEQLILLEKNINMLSDLYYDVKEYYQRQKFVLNEIFLECDSILPLCKNVGIAGFDYIRMFDIIRSSYLVKYLDESEAIYLLNKVGALCKNKFVDWQEYLSSVLFGKIFYSFDGMTGKTITTLEGFMVAIYRMIADDRIKKLQKNIWEQVDCTDLEGYLKPRTVAPISQKNTNEELISLRNIKDYRVLLAPNWKLTYEKNFSFSIEGKDGGFIGVHINNQLDYDSWEEFYDNTLNHLKESYGELIRTEEIHSSENIGKRFLFEQKHMGMKFLILADIVKCNTTYNMKTLTIQPSVLEADKHAIMVMLNSIGEVQ